MSKYYRGKRVRNIYDPNQKTPYRISRTGIDLFLECPRCFYIDKRLGLGRPPGYPYAINSLIDALLKKEFDVHRAGKTRHPLQETYGVDAVPFAHDELDAWRDSLHHGVAYNYPNSNLQICGGIDDVWVDPQGKLIVVDYKSTAKKGEVTIDEDWQISYKRQLEVYQWLFRKNGFEVSDTGYFVYANGDTEAKAFDGKIEFNVKVIPYKGNANWVEDAVARIVQTLQGDKLPATGDDCDYCLYTSDRDKLVSSFTR